MMTNTNPSDPLRTVYMSFDLPIFPRQIPQWRGAFVEMAGWEDDLFHNHQAAKKYHYRYPKLQYRTRKGQAAIFAMNEGIEALQKVLAFSDWKVNWQGEPTTLQIGHFGLNEHHFLFLEQPKKYRLYKWLALNPDNHRRYEACNGMVQRAQMLQKILRNHVLAGLWGLGWEPQGQVEVTLEKIHGEKYLPFHGEKVIAFDVTFSANVLLAPGMAIGKGVSLGFGWLYGERKKKALLDRGVRTVQAVVEK